MNVYEKFKSMTIDELAKWIDKYGMFDNSPWVEWWDRNYCAKCEPEIGRYKDSDRNIEFAWCELHDDKCKFFDTVIDSEKIIKLWLESED